jgi:guanylate cyclase soluble subunit beta
VPVAVGHREMYGVINYSVKALVLEKFGQETWTRICAEAGVEDDDFKFHDYHPDGQTVSLVLAASKVLGVEADQVLEIYGGYFLKFLEDEAMEKILHIMGSNLADFLDNLDWLHQHLRGTWQNALFPHFRRDVREDGDVDLYYQSSRGSLLAPFIKGLICAIAEQLYHTPVEIKILEANDNGAQFHIHFVPQRTEEGDTHEQAAQAKNGTSSAGQENYDAASLAADSLQAAGLPMSFFLSQWPFFVLMNEDMTLIAAGSSLTQKVPSAVPGANFHDIFQIEMPEAAAKGSFADFKEHAHAPFKVRTVDLLVGGLPLVLRGAMHCVEPRYADRGPKCHCNVKELCTAAKRDP